MNASFDQALPIIAKAYALTPPIEVFTFSYRSQSNTNIGLRTGDGDFVCKVYADIHPTASIHFEHRLLTWLAQAGLSFAVPAPLPTRTGELLPHVGHTRLALTPLLPGNNPDFGRPEHAELFGAALGELHTALQAYPMTPRPGRPLFSSLFSFPPPSRAPLSLTPQQLGLPDAPPYTEMLHWWRDEAAQVAAFVEQMYPTLPQQICHNDVTPANMLIGNGKVQALLDFEFTCPAARALDFAQALRMTTRVWENPEPWEEFRRFCRGYRRWNTLTELEIKALPWLIRLRMVTSALWWLGRMSEPSLVDRVVNSMTYLRQFVGWLEQDRHAQQLVDVIAQAVRE